MKGSTRREVRVGGDLPRSSSRGSPANKLLKPLVQERRYEPSEKKVFPTHSSLIATPKWNSFYLLFKLLVKKKSTEARLERIYNQIHKSNRGTEVCPGDRRNLYCWLHLTSAKDLPISRTEFPKSTMLGPDGKNLSRVHFWGHCGLPNFLKPLQIHCIVSWVPFCF